MSIPKKSYNLWCPNQLSSVGLWLTGADCQVEEGLLATNFYLVGTHIVGFENYRTRKTITKLMGNVWCLEKTYWWCLNLATLTSSGLQAHVNWMWLVVSKPSLKCSHMQPLSTVASSFTKHNCMRGGVWVVLSCDPPLDFHMHFFAGTPSHLGLSEHMIPSNPLGYHHFHH